MGISFAACLLAENVTKTSEHNSGGTEVPLFAEYSLDMSLSDSSFTLFNTSYLVSDSNNSKISKKFLKSGLEFLF